MKMCKVNIHFVLSLALMILAATSLGLAQNQVSVNFLGVTSLQSEARPNGVAGDDLTVKPSHPGHAAADVRPGTKALALAVPTSVPASIPTPDPQHVVAADPGFFGFPGITHFDQRFAGTGAYANTQLSTEPPDQGLCVGNGLVMEAVNNALAVYSQSGTRLAGPAALSQFFNKQPEVVRSNPPVYGQFLSDPRCYFDPETRRWFVTETEFGRNPNTGAFIGPSSILIGVSETSDPTGSYFLYSFDTTDGDGTVPGHPDCPCFGDQPLIGADANGFYVSTNEFPINGPGFNGAQVYAMSKSGLVQGSLSDLVRIDAASIPVPPEDQASGGLWSSLQPATSPGGGREEGSGTEYFLSALQFGPAPFDNRIAVWALTNTGSLASASPDVQLLHTVITTESYGMAPGTFSARQKRGSTPLRDFAGEVDPFEQIAGNDDRMNQVVFAAGDLWAGVNTSVASEDNARLGIAWFDISPSVEQGQVSASVHNQGYVSIAGQNVIFPSIGVNRSGNAVIAFTLVGHSFYPTAAYSPIANQAGDVRVAGAGVGPDDGFSGYASQGGPSAPIARWGDYSAAVADSEGNIWIGAEYIGQTCTFEEFLADSTCGGTRSLVANWGTFLGRLPSP
jgi:hypothetical protein